MNILFLDDEGARQDGFETGLQDFFNPDEVAWFVQARSAHEAIRALAGCSEEVRFDVAFLDHDLGTGCATGQEVADFIVREMSPSFRPRCVVVHSWNEPAAAKMVEQLKAAGVRVYRKPYSSGLAVVLRHLVTRLK